MNTTHPKILEIHLKRLAVIYIRQSSPFQVENHLESKARQYQLAERAQSLGWKAARCVVIDEDSGISGERPAAARTEWKPAVTVVFPLLIQRPAGDIALDWL